MSLRKLLKRKPQYKYKLNVWLWQLPTSDEYNAVVKYLAWYCCVSPHTFKKWRYIRENESAEIPQDAIIKICQFLNKDIRDIYTTLPVDFDNKENLFIKK